MVIMGISKFNKRGKGMEENTHASIWKIDSCNYLLKYLTQEEHI